MRRVLVVGVLVLTTPAFADHPRPEPGTDYVIVPPQPRTREKGTSHVIYLNRCASGCAVGTDSDDAFADQSTIPEMPGTLSPFAYGDADWDTVVACVRETYAAYGVEIVTDPPAPGTDHTEVMLAGAPAELGLDANILGIAPLAGDCSTVTNVIAFAFANIHPFGNLSEICATAAHEAGHTFGLDHEFECKDPMTYLAQCGQKQFINLEVPCGEFDGARECRCSGATQDSFKKLTAELGPGTLPGPPDVFIDAPLTGTVVTNGAPVFVRTVETRIVIRVELWINGWRWADTTPSSTQQDLFNFALPGALPDGVLDLEVRAVNDVGVVGTTTVRVTKGVPCTSAATCAAGQTCEADGRCVYPTPPGQLGDACTQDLDCASSRCLSDGSNQICTSLCLTDFPDDCPTDFTCLQTEVPTNGACWPDELLPHGGGCCQTGGGPAGPGVLALGTLALLLGRRRRR